MSLSITIKSSGDTKYEVSVEPSITVSELKNVIAEKSGIEASRQRLIYSGKVLKDAESVEFYKVQSGHTIHLVKSAAPKAATSTTAGAASSSTPAANAVPSNIAAGTGSFNPLSDLTGARYAGYTQLPSASMFGPDGGMNGITPDPEQVSRMMDNPMFLQQMNEMLSNPQMLDLMINLNPQLRAMGPQARQMLQSPFFRQMLTNPELMRGMMGGGGAGVPAPPAFPAPGANPTQASEDTESENQNAQNAQSVPPANPFASLFPNGAPPIDPFSLFGGAGGAAAAPPADNRPPEERYESQLRQLNDMGFFDFDRNVEALRRTGGSVQGAIEHLLGGN